MIFICGKGGVYLTDTAVEPNEKSLGYRTRKVENSMVMSWLLNSMTNETGENFMYYKTAKIWDAVRETYSNKDNTSAIFEIKEILQDLKQGEISVTDYFNMLISLLAKLDMLEDVTWKCADDGKQYKQNQEREQINFLGFEKYRPYNEGTVVRIADGTSSAVAGIGSVLISKDIRLDSVLFVPKLDFDLLSISKLTKDMNCITKLTSNTCEFHDLISGRTIGNADMSGGLYFRDRDENNII